MAGDEQLTVIREEVGEGSDADKLADNVVDVGTVSFRPATRSRELVPA